MKLFNASKNRLIECDMLDGYVQLKIGSPNGNFIQKTITVSEWPGYLNEKLNTGYSEIETKVVEKKLKLHPVLENLIRVSRQIVEKNYKFSVIPTAESIAKAKETLVELANITDLATFNIHLLDLFKLIPRKMKNPILFTAKSTDDIKDVLERENDLLSNLEVMDEDEEQDEEKLGISFEECNEKDKAFVKEKLGSLSRSFVNAYKVSNITQDSAFEEYTKKRNINQTKFLWHGSKTENWYSIIKTGLNLNPVNVVITGKMFGNGLYFAPSAHKSLGYTSISGSRWANGHSNVGYLALYEVATGHEYRTDYWTMEYTSLNETSFRAKFKGCDSFHALAGRNLRDDEVIVYNNAACRLRYLVEIKK